MDLQRSKYLGVLLFVLLVIAGIATSLYITQTSITDVDPSTYIIVPTIMLPLFAVFIFKKEVIAKVGLRDIALGIAAFAILLIATAFLRFEFSYLFLSYRLDMLLFPLYIVSVVLLVFGSGSVGRFKSIMAYSLLASPLLLIPFIEANQGFAVFNTMLIYFIAKVFVHNIGYIAPVTIASKGLQLGIGQACVGVGVLIGIVLFLIPLAYLYEGRTRDKVLWVLSGFLMLFFFNIIRMLS